MSRGTNERSLLTKLSLKVHARGGADTAGTTSNTAFDQTGRYYSRQPAEERIENIFTHEDHAMEATTRERATGDINFNAVERRERTTEAGPSASSSLGSSRFDNSEDDSDNAASAVAQIGGCAGASSCVAAVKTAGQIFGDQEHPSRPSVERVVDHISVGAGEMPKPQSDVEDDLFSRESSFVEHRGGAARHDHQHGVT
ncbi:unnamed protein product, partial [Amoebophrya sp. A120]|eukprot:GSA120T00015782001.1